MISQATSSSSGHDVIGMLKNSQWVIYIKGQKIKNTDAG
jgi:hypothetical protein